MMTNIVSAAATDECLSFWVGIISISVTLLIFWYHHANKNVVFRGRVKSSVGLAKMKVHVGYVISHVEDPNSYGIKVVIEGNSREKDLSAELCSVNEMDAFVNECIYEHGEKEIRKILEQTAHKKRKKQINGRLNRRGDHIDKFGG